MQVQVNAATTADLVELAGIAAATFPLACPPSAAAEAVDAFIVATLSASRFGKYLTDPDRVVLTATDADRIVGYAMLIRGAGTSGADTDVPPSVTPRPAVELSKMYVLPDWHGSGAAGLLMRAGITWAEASGASAVWLGVNQENQRAQRFYRKHGFSTVGARAFRLGATMEDDFVMVRPRPRASPA